MQKFSEYIQEGFFSRLKNKIKNAGTDLYEGAQFLKGDGFPEYLINITKVDKAEDIIEYTQEDTKGKITKETCKFQDWFDFNDVSWSDPVDEPKGSGEKVWRMMIDNKTSNIEITFDKGTKLEGTGDNDSDLKLKKPKTFFIKTQKRRDNNHDCYVYSSKEFKNDEKYDVWPFSITGYKKI